MTWTIKDIAEALHVAGKKASMDNAREYVEKHYDIALLAYWQDSSASLDLLDALMDTRAACDFDSSVKATLKITSTLDRAMEHAAWLIYDGMLEIEYDEREGDQTK